MLSPNNPLTDEKLNRTKKGNVESNRFKKLRRSDPESIHEVTIAVKQKNLDIISDMLTERSQPGNPNYQNWLSFSEVHSIIRNDEAVSAIQSWVKNFGGTVLFVTPHGDYIRAAAPVSTWERVFDTQFYVWESIKSTESAASSSSDRLKKKMFYHRAESYTIPDPLRKHISAVFQTTQAPVVPRRHGQRRPYQPTNPIDVSNSQNKSDVSLIPAYVAYGLTGDSRPASLNQMYGITSNTASPTLSQAVFETSSETMSQSDLKKFQQYYSLPQQAAILFNSTANPSCKSDTCGEGNLDIQYIMGIAQQAKGIFWYTNGTYIGAATDDPFVDFLTRVASEINPPTVLSISWGSDEQLNSPDYTTAFNNEAMKLGLRGVTIFVSSGDNGVSGNYCSCTLNSASNTNGVYWQGSNTWTGKGYFPSYPATSPFVVSVGATMGVQNGGTEISCQSQLGGVITSGGGFSTEFAQPAWQAPAVSTYLQHNTATSGYNAAGRGFPDVSFVGVNYPTFIGGNQYGMYGTSASTPFFAAMITLINSQRQVKGLGTVGFINPTMYANANKFRDITSGNNKCCVNGGSGSTTCCNSGFTSSAGWDPVTGLGSISFANLTAIFVTSATSPSSTTIPSTEPTTAYVSSRPSHPTKAPTASPTASSFKCPSFSTTGSKTVPCLFSACTGDQLLISSSPHDGGACSGISSTRSFLYDSTGLEVLSSNSFMYYPSSPSCTFSTYTVPVLSQNCQIYTLQQGCADSRSCAGQYSISGGGTYLVSYSPSIYPIATPIAPTRDPSSKPTCPTSAPSIAPSIIPTFQPSMRPSSKFPSIIPASKPSLNPSSPTLLPSCIPSSLPTNSPLWPFRTPTLLPLFSTSPSGVPASTSLIPSDKAAPGPIITSNSASSDPSFLGSTAGIAVISAAGAVGLVLLLLVIVYYRRLENQSVKSLINLGSRGKVTPAELSSQVMNGKPVNSKTSTYPMNSGLL